MLELVRRRLVVSVNEVSAHAHPMRMLRVDDGGHALLPPASRCAAASTAARTSPSVGDERRHLRVPTDVLFGGAEPVRRSRRRLPMPASAPSASTTSKTGPPPSAPLQGGSHDTDRRKPENVKAMDVEAHRDLRLLEAVHEDSRVTQRGMAKKLGIALGLANIYLKRMIHKGYIKVVNVQPNRISYLITPRGIAEKARLTYEFMDYSLHLYGEVRQHLREAMQDCAAAGKRVAIYGSGEAAELAYCR
jgi:ribosomal protein S25